MGHFLAWGCYTRALSANVPSVRCVHFSVPESPFHRRSGVWAWEATAGLQENSRTAGFVLRLARSCPGWGGSETGKGPDFSPASWASQVNSGGPPFPSFPCTPAPQGPGLAAGERKVPIGFFFLPLKGLQVFVPETHD